MSLRQEAIIKDLEKRVDALEKKIAGLADIIAAPVIQKSEGNTSRNTLKLKPNA